MPIYEYQCGACDHKFEILQKISDDLLTVCPDCNEAKLRKLVSAAAFHLKGTGWYVTDFKDKKPKQKADSKDDKSNPDKKADGEKTKSSDAKDSKSTDSTSKSKEATKKSSNKESSD